MHASEDRLSMIQIVTALPEVEIDNVDGIDLLDFIVGIA